jgi:hypothetical protein
MSRLRRQCGILELSQLYKSPRPVLFIVDLAADPEARVRFSAIPDFLFYSGSGTGSIQPREYN